MVWKGFFLNLGVYYLGVDSLGIVDDVKEENLEVCVEEGEVVGEFVFNDGSDGE